MAACLLQACAQSSITCGDLPKVAARMSNDEWRTVAFRARAAVPDYAAKVWCVAYLLEVA